MQHLKEELFAKVSSVLDASDGAAASSSDAASRLGADALAARWRDVLEKCASPLSHPAPHAC
jgi:hypothetical protein